MLWALWKTVCQFLKKLNVSVNCTSIKNKIKRKETERVTAIRVEELHSGHLLQRNESMCPHRKLHVNVHGHIICSSPTLETTKMSLGR